jgi:hypothetical protein
LVVVWFSRAPAKWPATGDKWPDGSWRLTLLHTAHRQHTCYTNFTTASGGTLTSYDVFCGSNYKVRTILHDPLNFGRCKHAWDQMDYKLQCQEVSLYYTLCATYSGSYQWLRNYYYSTGNNYGAYCAPGAIPTLCYTILDAMHY